MKKKYIVRLTYEVEAIIWFESGSGSEWEHEAALKAEQVIESVTIMDKREGSATIEPLIRARELRERLAWLIGGE